MDNDVFNPVLIEKLTDAIDATEKQDRIDRLTGVCK
jgi:hypothetical protein